MAMHAYEPRPYSGYAAYLAAQAYYAARERKLAEALLTLDRAVIEQIARGWGLTLPLGDHIFWVVVHKARTGLPSIPEAERQESRAWLEARGYAALSAQDE